MFVLDAYQVGNPSYRAEAEHVDFTFPPQMPGAQTQLLALRLEHGPARDSR